MELPIASKNLIKFCEERDHGSVFAPDDIAWRRYLEPCFAISFETWSQLLGARNQAGNNFDFEMALVGSTNAPNAICGFDGGTNYILLYHSLPVCLLEFFSRLLCSTPILSDCGDKDPNDKRKKFNSPLGFAIASGEVAIGSMDEVISVFGSCSRERRAMAFRLYYFAMQFVIEHEMGHAVAGHGQFAAEELCLPEINESEFRARSDSSTSNKIYAFLEERADYGSYFTIINYPVLRYVQTDHQEQPHERKAIIEEVKLKILAGASLAVFWMLSDVMEANGDVTAHEVWNDHPSSLARAISFCTMPIIAAQNKLSKAVSDIVEQGVYAAWDELFKLAGTSGLFRPFLQLRQLDLHKSVYAGRELERSEAEAILRKLERYKYRS